MRVTILTMPVSTSANLPCGTLYARLCPMVLSQNLESVTQYHTFQHFSTLFTIISLCIDTIAHGGEIYFTHCYTLLHYTLE